MNTWSSRLSAVLVFAVLVSVVPTLADVPDSRHSDTLMILSTTDVKGKTSPCGCHIPKGGLSRRASFTDSMRAEYANVALVDNGNFFPEDDVHKDAAWFLMDAMMILDVKAVGTSPNELRFGYALLKANLARTELPMTSANLIDAASHKPALPPYLITTVGSVRVGFFSLMPKDGDLGPARDSLQVLEPSEVARRIVPELRKKGATVVVLLSQLGKVESEDLVSMVPDIDAVICGHNVPMVQRGRMIKTTVASYGGEQGHYISRTLLSLDKSGKVTSSDNESITLDADVGEKLSMVKVVKTFEDALNEQMRTTEKERALASLVAVQETEDHFLGVEVCQRCHKAEFEQWKTTSHSIAWGTLIERRKDATPECIGCHVLGYKQNGGYQSSADVAMLSNVQCENCHGMGTRHDAFTANREPVTEQACVKCHQGENDSDFTWEVRFPKIAHGNLSAETIRNKKVKQAIPADRLKMIESHGGM